MNDGRIYCGGASADSRPLADSKRGGGGFSAGCDRVTQGRPVSEKKHPAPLAGGRKVRAMTLKKSNKTCTKVNLAWVPGTLACGPAGARGGRLVSGKLVYVFPAVVL